MNLLLARHAECFFWMGRYIERTSSLSRVLMTQTAFNRGRAEGAGWAWILALYDETKAFSERYGDTSAENVISFYLTDREHLGSIASSMAAARYNARALRALISTDFWIHINNGHKRLQNIDRDADIEQGLAHLCQRIQADCYALFGISEATFYRDEGWRFFRLGVEMERADQMSRLLDVRFAQLQTGTADRGATLGDFAFWSILLRSCGGHHAYRRRVPGPMHPDGIARFLIFDRGFARSLAHCVHGIGRLVEEFGAENGAAAPEKVGGRVKTLVNIIASAENDQDLLVSLHGLNDRVQSHIGALAKALGETYFDGAISPSAPSDAELIAEKPPHADGQEQTQTIAQIPGAATAALTQN